MSETTCSMLAEAKMVKVYDTVTVKPDTELKALLASGDGNG